MLKRFKSLEQRINISVIRYYPSKHSSWWRRTEDVFKTSSRRLQCNIFLSSKTSWRRLEDIIARRLANTSWRRLEDVLEDVLKTSWKRLEDVLQDVLKTSWRRFRKTYCKYVLKTSSRGLGRRKVLRWRRLQDVLKKSWKTRNVCWDISTI